MEGSGLTGTQTVELSGDGAIGPERAQPLVQAEAPEKRGTRRQRGALTIRDVASHAGVSPMTVSRVINGEPNVREETRTSVLASIKALNYSPNPAARSLASADSIRLGLLYSNPSASFLSELLVGGLDQCSRSGVQLLVEKCDNDDTVRDELDRLLAFGVDGIVLSPPLGDSEEVLSIVREVGIPAVVVAAGGPTSGICAVRIDDEAAAFAMTSHLIGLGHRRIGLIAGHPTHAASPRRLQGYLQALAQAGIAHDPTLVVPGYFNYRSGLEGAERLLSLSRPPSAIFALNDDMAAAACAVAHRMGLDIPHDLTVCGFDDTALATSVWPELTTIRQPIQDMARRSIEILMQEIKDRRHLRAAGPIESTVAFSLVRRGSDGQAWVEGSA